MTDNSNRTAAFHMGKGRVEAFSDGVIAIIITIMVLELKVPHGVDARRCSRRCGPCFLSYVLSFVYLGIYWNNHHHMLHACQRVTGPVLWANLHLLFWLSLVPFATGWMGENHFAARAVRAVWRRAADGRHRVLGAATHDHRGAGRRARVLRAGRGRRLEGQALARGSTSWRSPSRSNGTGCRSPCTCSWR